MSAQSTTAARRGILLVMLLLWMPDAAAAPAGPARGLSLAEVQAAAGAEKLAPGPYNVLSEEFELPRAGREPLPLKAYAPAPEADGPYPVILFSHGAGGNRKVAPGLLRHWASYGYVVIAPTHSDTLASDDERKGMRDVLRAFATDPDIRPRRVGDLTAILDALDELPSLAPILAGKLDATRIGAAGHSAGAMTAALLCGARIRGHEFSADPRVKACALLSGQGMTGPGGGFHRESWEELRLPLLVMSGSHDNSPRTRQTSSSRMHPYDFAPPGDKHSVFIDGALHMSFTGRAAGAEPGLAAAWLERYLGTPDLDEALEQYDQGAIFAYIELATLQFWEAYLKGDAAAQDWLDSGALAQLSGGQVRQDRK